MAVLHNLAGQNPKSEAIRRHKLALAWMIGFAAVGFIVAGVMLGLSVAWLVLPHVPHSALLFINVGWVLLCVGTVLAIRQAEKRIYPILNELWKERIYWLRGGQVEALVAMILRDLPEDWHIFNGVKLEATWDIDHILIGPAGIFCISTKSNRGIYSTGHVGEYLLNGKATDHVQQVIGQTMQLLDRMRAILGSAVPWVQPVLVAPLAWRDCASIQPKAWILHGDNLTDTIEQQSRNKVSAEEIRRCVKAVAMLTAGAAAIHRPADAPLSVRA